MTGSINSFQLIYPVPNVMRYVQHFLPDRISIRDQRISWG